MTRPRSQSPHGRLRLSGGFALSCALAVCALAVCVLGVCVLGVCVFAGGILAPPAWAASPPPPPKPAASESSASQPGAVSTADLQALLATLKSDGERKKLVARIEALIALRQQGVAVAVPAPTHGASPSPASTTPPAAAPPPSSPGAQAIAAASERIRQVSAALVASVSAVLNLPVIAGWAKQQVIDPDSRLAWLTVIIKLAAVLAAALAADWLVRLLLRRPRRSLADRPEADLWLRIILLGLRGLLDLLAVAVFGIAAYVVLPFTNPSGTTRIVVLAVVNATVLLRAVLVVGRTILVPGDVSSHPLSLSGETASYWFVWLRRLVGLGICGYIGANAALLVGLPPSGYEVILRALGLALAALGIILVLQNREPVAHWIRGRAVDRMVDWPVGLRVLRTRAADVWHVLAILYIIGIFGVWALQVPGGFEFLLRASFVSVVVLTGARFLSRGIDNLLRRFFAIGHDLRLRFPALEERADRYMPILSVALRVVIHAGAALILLQAWGFGSFDWLVSGFGRLVLEDAATLLITLMVALLAWESFSIGTEYYLAQQAAATRPALRRARARTLLPLLRRTVAIVLIIFVLLIVLSELGVNIAPLLAGAGVVGIAIGLGAQGFVKDLINGLSLLFEDTFVVGDVVTIGGDSGVVEAITMRTIRLRDGNGAVRTIPFSEITRVVNSTRDFGIAAFNIPIGFREDIDRAMAAIQAVGDELKDDPQLGRDILEPLSPPFVDHFGDYAIFLYSQIKTLPGRHWAMAHAFNLRLKRRFDALGIEMPLPSRRLYVDGGYVEGGATEARKDDAPRQKDGPRTPAAAHASTGSA